MFESIKVAMPAVIEATDIDMDYQLHRSALPTPGRQARTRRTGSRGLRQPIDEPSVVMTSLDAFKLFVGCLESEGALPVLEEALSLHALVKSWCDQGDDAVNNETPLRSEISINKRERQIIELLSVGLSNAQIAKRCFLSEGTVKWYLHALFVKFGVGNRTALLHVVSRGFIAVSSNRHARRSVDVKRFAFTESAADAIQAGIRYSLLEGEGAGPDLNRPRFQLRCGPDLHARPPLVDSASQLLR